MKERPILFTGDMANAILDERKTQSRRTRGLEKINNVPGGLSNVHLVSYGDASQLQYDYDLKPGFAAHFMDRLAGYHFAPVYCPYGQPGDILWVKETWAPAYHQVLYRSNERYGEYKGQKWKSPRFMPKSAARIWLQVTDIRVERVQDISWPDVTSEGFVCLSKDHGFAAKHDMAPTWKYGLSESDGLPGAKGWQWEDWEVNPVDAYRKLWSQINGAESWDDNPWVWVITFRVLSTNGRPEKFPALCEAI